MLPYELRDEFVKGNVVLFVGAGFVRNYLSGMPLWPDLLKTVFSTLNGKQNEVFNYCDDLFDAKGNRVLPPGEYLRLAQKFELARGSFNKQRRNARRPEIPSIHEIVRSSIQEVYDVWEAHRAVQNTSLMRSKTLPLPIWVTTNYDTFLEDTVLADGIQSKSTAVLKRPIRNSDFGRSAGAVQTLFKIHGCVDSKPEQSIVITEEDYHRFLRQDKYIINKLYTLFCERTVVFLGYGLNDPNIQFIYHEVLFDQKTLADTEENESFSQFRPAFFVTQHAATEQDKAYYRHKRIRYVDGYSIEHFFQELVEAFERDQRHRVDATEAIRQDIAQYQAIFEQLNWNTDPNSVQVPDELKRDYLARILDLVELYEIVYRRVSPLRPALSEFDPVRMSGFVQGAQRLLDEWVRLSLSEGRTDVLESVVDFMERKLNQRRQGVFKELLNSLVEWLTDFQGVRGLDHFVERYVKMLCEYDKDYNDWGDYTYCLGEYVRATQLFQLMSRGQQSRVASGLHDQLEMCGRGVGDSWYTTNSVYTSWQNLNAAAWPLLEAAIRRHRPLGVKQQAMLDYLRPGADFTQFLPRA